jgi:hypothetical protein
MIITLFCALVVFGASAFGQYVQGERPQTDYTKLEVLVYPSGLTGFFDRETGRLYIYGSRLDECIMIRQMTVPGRSMKVIKG